MHLTDEDLLGYQTGEPDATGRVAAHLSHCDECRAALAAFADVVAAFDGPPVPEPGPAYGARVWLAIEDRLGSPTTGRGWGPSLALRLWGPHAALAAGLAALLAAGFAAQGRVPAGVPALPDGRDRILVAAVADHLDRAARMLTDINNAEAPAEIVEAMALADDLASANRLYRQAAAQSGDTGVVVLLDDLERVLLDVVHDATPSPGAPDLDELRARLATRDAAHRVQLAKSTLD